jgi:hypothetical protein
MMQRILSRLHRPAGEPEPVEPVRAEPGTLEAAAYLAHLAERLRLSANDTAAIRAGIVAPDLAEWIEAVDKIRKPDSATVLRALGDIHAEASEKARRYASNSDLGKRFARAAFYAANARTFWQAAKMAEGSIHGGKSNA